MVTAARVLALAAAASTAGAYEWSNTTHAAHYYHAPARRLALSCALQSGVDFVGNDLASVAAPTAADCCAKCSGYANCGAFSWTDFQGGTCWLKSGRGQTKAAAGTTSAVVSSIAATCSVQDNTDFAGNDLANAPAKTPGDCCDKCSATQGCGAYTWTDFQGGTCWLKTGKGAPSTVSGASSGVVVPATCSAETDVDYDGNDLASVAGSAASCCAKCAATSRCKAYTWSDYQGGTCWLKSAKGVSKSSPGKQSGEVGGATPPITAPPPTLAPPPTTPVPTTTAPANPACRIEYNIDYAGNDIGSVAGGDASACCSKCLDNPGCNAFTWSGFNGGTCFLKSGKGSSSSSSGVHSAVVTRPPPQNSCNMQYDTDFFGLDIANVQRSKSEDCCDACASYSGCGAFTWSDFNGGTCWLKSAAGQASHKPGSHSAIVNVVNPPKTHIQYRMRTGEIPLKSVNLGAWLVGEYWMSYTSPAWKSAWDYAYKGEMAVMRGLGHGRGDGQFEEHRRSWITEEDIRQIAAAGLNSVRVPVGYWIVADDPTTWKNDDMRTFAPGGLKYLDKLINEWAVKYNLAVMLSCHAHQGSQNGYDHSAPPNLGQISWGWPESVESSLQLVTFLAARYKLSPAFLGMNLMNEPALGINVGTLINYYYEAYRRVRATGNDCILVTSPLLQRQGPNEMTDLMRWPAYNNVWHEFHLYFKWGIYENMNEWEVMNQARQYRSNNLNPWPGNYLYMGEWALCSPEKNAKFENLDTLRQFGAIQLEQFKGAHSGWAFWSWKHGDEGTLLSRGWSLREMLRLNVLNFK